MNEPLGGRPLISHSHDNNSLPYFLVAHPTPPEHGDNYRHEGGVNNGHRCPTIPTLVPKFLWSIRRICQCRPYSSSDRPEEGNRPRQTVWAENQYRTSSRELHPPKLVRENVPEAPPEREAGSLELGTCDGASGWRVDEGGRRGWDLGVDLSFKDEGKEGLVGECNVGNRRAVDGHCSTSAVRLWEEGGNREVA